MLTQVKCCGMNVYHFMFENRLRYSRDRGRTSLLYDKGSRALIRERFCLCFPTYTTHTHTHIPPPSHQSNHCNIRYFFRFHFIRFSQCLWSRFDFSQIQNENARLGNSCTSNCDCAAPVTSCCRLLRFSHVFLCSPVMLSRRQDTICKRTPVSVVSFAFQLRSCTFSRGWVNKS